MREPPILLWPGLDPRAGSLRLEGEALHHVCRVLRLGAGDAVELRDGRGLCAEARLTSVSRDAATVELLRVERPAPPALPLLHLALPLLKGRRLDWALEKGTELGVAGFHLYHAQHAVVRREEAPGRYAEILRSAYAQSRRLLAPALDGPQDFAALLATARAADWRQVWADERRAGAGQAPLAVERDRPLLVWIGPEGGFSTEERAALAEAAELVLDLGHQRLRAETAAIAAACRFLLPVPGQAPPR